MLSPAVRAAFRDPTNQVFLSAVSAWEIGVKHAIGRLPLPAAPREFVPAQRAAMRILPLALEESDALELARLPDVHRDPFDRMLICQAISRGLVLAASDGAIHRYPVRTLW